MEILERIWEIIAGIGNAILGRFERGITGLFGSANARFLKRLQPRVEAIGALDNIEKPTEILREIAGFILNRNS